MQKAKVALVEAGIIKSAGRGRISADGHAWLKARYDEGMRFSDWPKGQIQVTESEATNEKPAETKVRVIRDASESNEKVIYELMPMRYSEDEFVAVEKGTGKTRSLREACRGCSCSLVGCWCKTPRIVKTDGSGSVEVTIKRK